MATSHFPIAISRRAFVAGAAFGVAAVMTLPFREASAATILLHTDDQEATHIGIFNLTQPFTQETSILLDDATPAIIRLEPEEIQLTGSDLGDGNGTWKIY